MINYEKEKKEMDDIYILKEIAKFDRNVWKLFRMLNKECYEYFIVKGYEYELNFRTIKIDGNGTWYELDGQYHRSDGPAMIWNSGSKSWWCNGNLHRLDGPAVIHNNAGEEWWVNGKLHRTDGPAIIYNNGDEEWWVNSKRHRIGGPAIVYYKYDRKKYNRWFIDGKLILKENEKE